MTQSSRECSGPYVTVDSVAPDSIAEEVGLEPGSQIERINGQSVRDSIDYMYALQDEERCIIEWTAPDGELYEADIEKEPQEELGVNLRPARIRTCRNRCLFCFVDQMPKGMRPTLYVKDDDWRSSFLHGTYVTLTNLSREDVERIKEQRTSPLYISVHAADDAVRSRLLGTDAGAGTFRLLHELVDAGIEAYAQAVVCEGVNDGEVLEETIDRLYEMHPRVRALSIVPVGLTQFRRGLPSVHAISPRNAGRILDLIEQRQQTFLASGGSRFVFGADELYVISGREVPGAEAYEGFEQLDNGVGLIANYSKAFRDELRTSQFRSQRRVVLVTGQAFAPTLRTLAREVEDRSRMCLDVLAVTNTFFGPSVTVAGLLTGRDVIEAVRGIQCDAVFVPDIMFRDSGTRTLDDVEFADIARAAGVPCFRASSEGDEFIGQLVELESLLMTEGGQ